MGGAASSECACQDGLLGMCAPQDPKQEDQNTVVAHPPPVYPGAITTAATVQAPEPPRTANLSQGFSGADDPSFSYGDEMTMAAPPAPFPDPPMSGRQGPPTTSQQRQQRPDVTVDDILANLENSEEMLYGNVFSQFPGGASDCVTLDCAGMRDFLCTNTSIPMDDLDMELLKVAPEATMTQIGFIQLLREFSVSDGECLEQFLSMSGDGDSLASEECRSALLMFASQKLHANFGDERWDRIFNVVMWDAGTKVQMEQWHHYCKHTGRLVRLLRYAQV